MCSWCLRTTVGAFCILASPLIPLPSGLLSPLREAFPWETAPRYLLRDRDRIFGADFVTQMKAMGIKQVLSAPRSPWQRASVERVIGTIRRECLDHVIVFSEASLYRHLRNFADYYHWSRTHLGLQKDTPESRPRPSCQKPGGSWRSPKSVDSIIGTNVAPPERCRDCGLRHRL